MTDMQDFLGIRLQITSHRTKVKIVVAVTQGTSLPNTTEMSEMKCSFNISNLLSA